MYEFTGRLLDQLVGMYDIKISRYDNIVILSPRYDIYCDI